VLYPHSHIGNFTFRKKGKLERYVSLLMREKEERYKIRFVIERGFTIVAGNL
jgi:hypothetical protein